MPGLRKYFIIFALFCVSLVSIARAEVVDIDSDALRVLVDQGVAVVDVEIEPQ